MRDLLSDMDLYICTDRKLSVKSDQEVVRDAIAGGAKVIQYREKELPGRDMFNIAMELREITYSKNVIFIVNDRVDIAKAVDADGVHLGQDDLPIEAARKLLGSMKIIGLTARTVEEAIEAERKGANYLGVSPIFATGTKADAGPAAGLQLIRDVKAKCSIPIVAIGGIDLDNIQSVLDAGAQGACAVSAIVTKDDIAAEVKKFKAFWK